MKEKQPVIAVFDIGKTNKKLLVFDAHYRVLREDIISFPELKDEDGFPCEDIDALSKWMLQQVGALKHDGGYELKAINFATYGASMIYLDEDGKRVAPLYNYLKPYPPDLLKRFESLYNTDNQVSLDTASPLMGHLNAGLQLYWLKNEKPDLYKKTSTALHLPQYLSNLLTGKLHSERSILGCHTAMWNFSENRYHPWLEIEGLDHLLPPVILGNETFSYIAGPSTITVGPGLHDSSSAMIPYLQSFDGTFVILSTGTWSISLNPFNNDLPDRQELESGCLSYLRYTGEPVKVSRLFAGYDHDLQVKRIASHFQLQTDFAKELQYDPLLAKYTMNNLIGENTADTNDHCVFHKRDISSFSSAAQAYHQLISDMVKRQLVSTQLVMPNGTAKHLCVDGGFSKNEIYMRMLSQQFPGIEVRSSSMVQGTALGAALAIHSSWNEEAIPKDLVTLKSWNS